MMQYQMDYLFSMVGVLLSVAFFTLMERKIMGLAHYRKGPNKVVMWGLTQPMTDALKLLSKEMEKLSFSKTSMYMSGPCVSMTLMILCWAWYEYLSTSMSSNMKIMCILAVMSLSAYSFLLTSWGSNSKYALIGGYRAIAQIISYEVCLTVFIMVLVYINKSYSVSSMKTIQENMWFLVWMPPLFVTWAMICMAESNRTPFDLAEGESEIVSGFNIEYGGGLFALIFISEYGMIIMMSYITSMMFMGSSMILMKTLMVCMVFIWVRCTFPRVRYDNLMMCCWKMALPYSLATVMMTTSMVM